jgi:hypothetical protein
VGTEKIHDGRSGGTEDERRLLLTVFAELPVPTFVLTVDGAIRRSNRAAADLVGASPTSLTRRRLVGLLEQGSRGAYRTRLSTVVRDGTTTTLPVRITTRHGAEEVTMTLRWLALERSQRVVAAVGPPAESRAGEEGIRDGRSRSFRETALLLNAYTSLAATAARTERTLDEARAQNTNLRKALDSRGLIGQATGIVMASRRMSADEAFALLSRASQNHNVKLVRLAELLIAEPDLAHRL